jgi:hypothetical protein
LCESLRDPRDYYTITPGLHICFCFSFAWLFLFARCRFPTISKNDVRK